MIIDLIQNNTYQIKVNNTVIVCEYNKVSLSKEVGAVFHFTALEDNNFNKKGYKIRFYENDINDLVKWLQYNKN